MMRWFPTLLLCPLLAVAVATQAQTSLPHETAPSPLPPSTQQPAQPVSKVGGSVLPPTVVSATPPQFSEQARKAKVGGDVLVGLEIDTNGNPQHVRVIRGIGMGLDEKAVEAVKQYRFKPAMKDGKPVPVAINIQVNFRIADPQ